MPEQKPHFPLPRLSAPPSLKDSSPLLRAADVGLALVVLDLGKARHLLLMRLHPLSQLARITALPIKQQDVALGQAKLAVGTGEVVATRSTQRRIHRDSLS